MLWWDEVKIFFAQAEHLERQGQELLEEDIASTDELSVIRRFLLGLPKACQSTRFEINKKNGFQICFFRNWCWRRRSKKANNSFRGYRNLTIAWILYSKISWKKIQTGSHGRYCVLVWYKGNTNVAPSFSCLVWPRCWRMRRKMMRMAAKIKQDSVVQKAMGVEPSLEVEMGTLEIMRPGARRDQDRTSS